MTESFRVYDFEDTSEDKPRKKLVATPYVWRDPETIPPRAWLYGRHYIRKFVSATATGRTSNQARSFMS